MLMIALNVKECGCVVACVVVIVTDLMSHALFFMHLSSRD